MNPKISKTRRALIVSALSLGINACVAHGTSYEPPVLRSGLIQVEVYDRTHGTTLAVHSKDRHRYIIGTPAHEYALRIRNTTNTLLLVVASVDGVNVISGETAAPSQSGYVLDPWGSVEVIGWRKSLERTAAFFFTEHQNSYAARTGRPNNVGVIGVAAFREKVQPIARLDREFRGGEAARESAAAAPDASASSPLPAPSAPASEDVLTRREAPERPARQAAKLGTGHGRDETSRVTLVQFERASDTPAQTVTIRYDRRENLVAMGVLPTDGRYAQREPEPFPGTLRFAPDPPRW